jgi:hypothetical protein
MTREPPYYLVLRWFDREPRWPAIASAPVAAAAYLLDPVCSLIQLSATACLAATKNPVNRFGEEKRKITFTRVLWRVGALGSHVASRIPPFLTLEWSFRGGHRDVR